MWKIGPSGITLGAAREKVRVARQLEVLPEVNGVFAEGGAPDAEAMRELARELYWFQNEDGMWVIHAMLPPEQGQLVIKALQAMARPLAKERQEAWRARQKARMQAVARKLLQRNGTSTDAITEGGALPGGAACGCKHPARTEVGAVLHPRACAL